MTKTPPPTPDTPSPAAPLERRPKVKPVRPPLPVVPEHALRVVVLAAGSGKRMQGAPEGGKLATVIDDRTVLEWTLHLLAGQADELDELLHAFVVIKPQSTLTNIVTAFDGGPRMTRQVVTATHARRGMAWSLRAGLDAALGGRESPVAGVHGAFVLPADDPLAALDLALVARAANRESDRPTIVDRGAAGAPHPAWIPIANAARFVPPMKGPGADRGLRGLLHRPVTVESGRPAPVDLDRPADIALLTAALAERT